MQSIQWIGLSPLGWLVFFGVSGGLAWLIYRKETKVAKPLRFLLGVLRASSLLVLLFLLAQVYWKFIQSETLTPAWWIVWDQSKSMQPNASDTKKIRTLLESLEGDQIHMDLQGTELPTWQMPSQLSSPILSGLLRLSQNRITQSSPRLLLISDGLVNEGVRSVDLPFPLYAIGVGDTTVKPDARVKRFAVNDQVSVGNPFQIETDIQINQLKGSSFAIHLTRNGQIIQTRNWTSANSNDFLPWVWTTTAPEKGTFIYGVKVVPDRREVNTFNNEMKKPVEVIENKQKILILAHAPHPDIRSLKASILKSNQFDVEEWIIPALGSAKSPVGPSYAGVILHQLPSRSFPQSVEWISRWKSQGIPLFFIVGNETNLPAFNGVQNVVGIQGVGNKQDRARGRWIAVDNQTNDFISNLDPLLVPFGTYVASKEPEIWIDQLIGTVPANRPLLLVGNKEAALLGEGIWKWRMEVAENPQQVNALDQLWIRLMQQLLNPSGQARLQVNTEKSVYSRGETISFWSETWDRAGHALEGVDIKLTLTHSKQSKVYSFTSGPASFQLSGLTPGAYTFTAEAICDGLPQKVKGSFLLNNQWIEDENRQADFGWLREITNQNGGEFLTLNNLEKWINDMNQNPPPGKITVSERRKQTIDLPWLGGLLLMLMSLEWIIRKYVGLY